MDILKYHNNNLKKIDKCVSSDTFLKKLKLLFKYQEMSCTANRYSSRRIQETDSVTYDIIGSVSLSLLA